MPKALELENKVFGRWTVIKRQDVSHGRSSWLCECLCGNSKIISGRILTRGESRSCGCLKSDTTTARNVTHGATQTTEFSIWQNIKQRCNNKNNPNYHHYGGRGIKMCDEWDESFENFGRDMGMRPSKKHTIDRIDNNKGYYKENCRWATHKQQSRNTRSNVNITHNGITMCINDWAKKTGLSRMVIKYRLKSGWPIIDVLEKSVNSRNAIK